MATPRTIRLSPDDNVVVAVDTIPQGTAAAGVTGGEDTVDRGAVRNVCLEVAAFVALDAELVGNVSLRVLPTERPDAWEVQGRGELALAVLVEDLGVPPGRAARRLLGRTRLDPLAPVFPRPVHRTLDRRHGALDAGRPRPRRA